MKVGGAGRAQGPQKSGKASGAKRHGETFRLDGLDGPEAARSASGVSAAAPVDALLALQEVPDATENRQRAVARGEAMLDMLDDIKLSLLAGELPKAKLDQLLKVVENRRDSLADGQDARLKHVLDEIELRARVELAKHERAFAR